MRSFRNHSTIKVLITLVGAAVLGFGGWAKAVDSDIVVSQKGRKFDPTSISLNKGGALIVVNDDGDLLHHAYVESDDFSFDSGDQKPGSRTRIVFPVAGDFKLLCGIHPKMKLAVHIR